MIVAAVNWEIRAIGTPADFLEHLEEVVKNAKAQAAELVVLPELLIVELLNLHRGSESKDAPKILEQYNSLFEEKLAHLAVEQNLVVIGGSHFKKSSSGFNNTTLIAWPDRSIQMQTKNCLTQWEIETWNLVGSDSLTVMQDKRLGVTICYDSEFPEAVRAHTENGVQILAVPSYTETVRGFQRVRWCCLARAVENQIFVLHSACVADEALDFQTGSAYGSSAVIAPSILPFKQEAILAESAVNKEGIAVAELDFDALHRARTEFEVRNWHDRHKSRWKLSF